ncbi:MAG TPA: hypothetical protein DG757_09490 [Bacillus sp. (in: Bacteria)]|nr:hypothetical protein [Bacillus sp. (in: firmicutes)]
MSKKISDKTLFWDFTIHKILNLEVLNDVIKFHQSSTRIERDRLQKTNTDIQRWLDNVESSDNLPNIYTKEIALKHINEINFPNSQREFTDENISELEFCQLLYNSFGRSKNNPSKRYPSAGSLYPVIPLIYLFEKNAIEGMTIESGVYVFNTYKNSIRLVKELNSDEKNEIKRITNTSNPHLVSKYCIGYAIDMKRAVAKYHRRGYRHALIEIGLAAQCFRESCKDLKNIGEVCWSGFDDNSLTHISGMNPRTAPITLLQWFGKYERK